MMRHSLRLLATASVLSLLAVACSAAKDTGLPASPTPTPSSAGGGTSVEVADNVFRAATLEIKAGQTVTWSFVGTQPHSVTSDTGIFNSHPKCAGATIDKCSKQGEVFKFTFAKPGDYPYFCLIHGFKGGLGMAGKIVVKP